MVAIVAMILGYMALDDLKVAIYIGIGIMLAKWLMSTVYRKDDDD